MNRTRFALLNAGLLAIALALSLALLWQRDQRETWRRKIGEAEQRLHQSTRPSPGRSVATAATGASPTNSTASAAATAKATSPEAAERARILAEHRRHQEELNTLNGYSDGFVALQLPPATIERAKQIILDEQQAVARALAAIRSAEVASGQPDPEDYRSTLTQYQQSLQAELSGLLGEGVYEDLEAYHQQSGIDWAVGTDLWDAGVPLSGDQLHALALAEVRTHFERQNPFEASTGSRVPDPATGLSIQDLTLLAQSSQFLSAAQQDTLRQSLIEDHQYNAAMAGFTAKQRAAWQAARNGMH